jgi:hypothetical protein
MRYLSMIYASHLLIDWKSFQDPEKVSTVSASTTAGGSVLNGEMGMHITLKS